jgi:threonine aldolase
MTRIAESAAVLAAGPLERVAKGLELLGGAFGGDTLTESVLAINKVDPKVRQRVSSADIGGGGFMSDIASGNFTNAFWREQFTAIEYMRARNEQASMRATGGVDANGVVVRLAPESIDALNSGEIQSERRTRLD